MKKRFLCLGLLVAVSQLFATGCHPIERWRSNHPCGTCGPCSRASKAHPLMHPIQTRHAAQGDGVVSGPVVGAAPCQSCGGGTSIHGAPVGFNPKPGEVVPITTAPPGYPHRLSGHRLPEADHSRPDCRSELRRAKPNADAEEQLKSSPRLRPSSASRSGLFWLFFGLFFRRTATQIQRLQRE